MIAAPPYEPSGRSGFLPSTGIGDPETRLRVASRTPAVATALRRLASFLQLCRRLRQHDIPVPIYIGQAGGIEALNRCEHMVKHFRPMIPHPQFAEGGIAQCMGVHAMVACTTTGRRPRKRNTKKT
jgi:hypothetical protein